MNVDVIEPIESSANIMSISIYEDANLYSDKMDIRYFARYYTANAIEEGNYYAYSHEWWAYVPYCWGKRKNSLLDLPSHAS